MKPISFGAGTLVIKSINLLILAVYVPGLIFGALFPAAFDRYFVYDGYPLFYFLVSYISVMVGLYLLLPAARYVSRLRVVRFSQKQFDILGGLLALAYFGLSLVFFVVYDTSFRHKVSMSEAGLGMMILFVLRYFGLFYCLYYLRIILNQVPPSKINSRTLLILVLSAALSLNSAIQVLFILFGALLLISPQSFVSLKKLSAIRLITFIFAGLLSVVLVFFVGVGNKVGYSFLLSYEGLTFLKEYVEFVVPRTSTSLYSLGYALENYLFDSSIFVQLVSGELATLLERIKILLGIPIEGGSEIQTVSRFNYLSAFENHAPTAGATPGLLASIYYASGIPFGLIFIYFYIWCIVTSAVRLMGNIRNFSIISLGLIAYCLLPLFENPIALVNILQPTSVYFFVFFFLSWLSPRIQSSP